ncbi:MAG: hypothetical protein A3F18_02120 [Legionellales bacterium RIFCSPHIGHO2_12_FULL_37_14]|nr:MAG: hypothetical protein A3F18_02120 [Legionellales bacterium RIFCSPHIGHO2_12_FULL_37_14]
MSINEPTNTKSALHRSWLICFAGMLFYCFNYFLRSSPSFMQSNLIEALHLTATQFGTMISFYYFAYTPMQIPAGMIYDKFGVRFVLFSASLVAVIGLSFFCVAESFLVACLGRFLIGLGSAFAYIGVLKLASIWLPPTRFALAAGMTTAIGMSSAALSQKYLSKLIDIFNYKPILQVAIIIGIIVSLFILYMLRHKPHDKVEARHTASLDAKNIFSILKVMFSNPQMWIVGIIGCVLYLPSVVFLDVYGISYFKIAHNMSSEQAANVSALTFFGWILGGPIMGILSDKMQKRTFPLMLTSAITAVLLYAIFYYPGLTVNQLYVAAFFAGICCGAHPLCFAIGKENYPQHLAGTAVAVTNTFIMLGGVIFPPIIGSLLDLHTNGHLSSGLPIYTAHDYTFALNIVPLGVILGTVLTFFLKETYGGIQVQEKELAGTTESTDGRLVSI